jgi:glutamate racemase
MIGLFDSGHGGLTVLRIVAQRFPHMRFAYLGDHAHAPYGNRTSEEVVALTRDGVTTLFGLGCRLVMLACNTATAVAGRRLQREWLPHSGWTGHNVIGIIAPTVEAATQTPWAVSEPQYPQKYNTDMIAVFGTRRTIQSGVYTEEIRKRCPKVTVVEQACPDLAGAIEAGAPNSTIEPMVADYVAAMLRQTDGAPPHRAILGCTHYPLVEPLFRIHLPPFTRILAQPEIVADSLEDYLARHPHYVTPADQAGQPPLLLTTGPVASISESVARFWPDHPGFRQVDAVPQSARLGQAV